MGVLIPLAAQIACVIGCLILSPSASYFSPEEVSKCVCKYVTK